jgi:hypothetical protein
MILFQMHIMYYESHMIVETLNSIYQSLYSSPDTKVKLKFCLNSQTYIEKPEHGKAEDMFNLFLNHVLFDKFNCNITYKTDNDPFYNIADWRRDTYDPSFKYNVWGESDTLLPIDFFYILDKLEIQDKHLLTFASRPMWDSSWDIVTHSDLQGFSKPCLCGVEHREDCIELLEEPLKYKDYIKQGELDQFNQKYEIEVEQVPLKIDGSLVCISADFPFPFIPDSMHFVREDTCLEIFSKTKQIVQFCVKTRLKGHNYKHPLKRVNTKASREDKVFKEYADKSSQAMSNFLTNLINNESS